MVAAAALLRAVVCDDGEAGVLIIEQNGRADGDVAELTELLLAMAVLSRRVLVSANGGNVGKVLALCDQWSDGYARAGQVLPP